MARKLAVVVLNYNDPLSTIRYVNEIKNYKHIDQIIIVDNCSTDGSFETLKELKEEKIEVIKTNENKGYAYGNNFAIHYLNQNIGEFKYIAISNPDVEVSEDAYDQCLNYLDRNQDVAIAAPRMYDVNDNPHQLSGWKIRSLKGDIMDSSLLLTEVFQRPHIERYSSEYLNQDVAFVDCVAGSFFIIRHSAFKEIGYFDEHTFLYFEEDILGSKLKKRNYKNVVLNTCRFKHYESITIDKNMNFMRKYRNLQKSKRYFHKTYNDRASRLKLLVLDFFTAFRTVEQNSVPVARKLRLDRAFRKFRVKAVAAKRLGLKGTLFKVGSKMKNGVNKSGSKIKRFIKKQFGKLNCLAKKINRKIFNTTTLIRVLKVIIVFINIILLPFIYLFRLFHVKKRVLYFSVVTWKWIKQRPHFVPLELVKSSKYKVDYRYQTLYKKHMPNETNKYVDNKIEKTPGFKVKPFPIFPANGKYIIINSIWNVVRSSFWYYDKIILTHPNQIDLMDEIMRQLKFMPFQFDIYITTDTKSKSRSIQNRFFDEFPNPKVELLITENRGRDVAPFLTQMKNIISEYDFICHIHTKKSSTAEYGERWRKYLFDNLFGSTNNIIGIFHTFASDPGVGLIYPATFPEITNMMEFGGNRKNMIKLAKKLNITEEFGDRISDFPSGTMFWAKVDAIKPLFELKLSPDSFDEEDGQIDGTLAHAIERIFCYLVKSRGYKYVKTLNRTFEVIDGEVTWYHS